MDFLENFKNDLWKKIREEFNPSIMDKHYLTSEIDKIISGKIDGLNTIMGFFYFNHPLGNKQNALKIVEDLDNYKNFINGIIETSDWKTYKVFILTPFQISEISELDLSKFDIGRMHFGYLSNFPNFNKNHFKLHVDNGVVTKIVADKLYETFK